MAVSSDAGERWHYLTNPTKEGDGGKSVVFITEL